MPPHFSIVLNSVRAMFPAVMKYEILVVFVIAVACGNVEAAPSPQEIKEHKLFDQWNFSFNSDSSRTPREEGHRKKRQTSNLAELSTQIILQEHQKGSAVKQSRKSRATTMTFAFEIDDILAYFLGESWRGKKD